MSLINEALKRTRDAAYQAPPPRPVSAEPYRVTTPPTPLHRGARVPWEIGLGVGLIVLVTLGAVYYRFNQAAPRLEENTPTLPPPVAAVPAVVELPAEPPPVPVAPPPEPGPPKLVLQGITGDATGREALINGITLRVGEELEGARVLAIEARAVKLQFAGKEIQLRMP